jgi:hypothetical protein
MTAGSVEAAVADAALQRAGHVLGALHTVTAFREHGLEALLGLPRNEHVDVDRRALPSVQPRDETADQCVLDPLLAQDREQIREHLLVVGHGLIRMRDDARRSRAQRRRREEPQARHRPRSAQLVDDPGRAHRPGSLVPPSARRNDAVVADAAVGDGHDVVARPPPTDRGDPENPPQE